MYPRRRGGRGRERRRKEEKKGNNVETESNVVVVVVVSENKTARVKECTDRLCFNCMSSPHCLYHYISI